MKRILCAAILAAGIAGCASAANLHSIEYAADYEPADLGYFNYENGMRVIVLNNPTDTSMAQFRTALARAMDGKNYGAPVTFKADPQSDATFDTRVIVTFDPANVPAKTLCLDRTPSARPEPTGGRIEMLMVYCKYDKLQSTLVATTDSLGTVGDRNFNDFVGEATRTLLNTVPSRRQTGDN